MHVAPWNCSWSRCKTSIFSTGRDCRACDSVKACCQHCLPCRLAWTFALEAKSFDKWKGLACCCHQVVSAHVLYTLALHTHFDTESSFCVQRAHQPVMSRPANSKTKEQRQRRWVLIFHHFRWALRPPGWSTSVETGQSASKHDLQADLWSKQRTPW